MEWLFWGLSAACFLAVAIGVIAEQKAAKAREGQYKLLLAALFARDDILVQAVNAQADAINLLLLEREKEIDDGRKTIAFATEPKRESEDKPN